MTVSIPAHRWSVFARNLCFRASALLFLAACGASAAQPNDEHRVRLVVQAAYLPQIPVLVRVELIDATGQPDRSVWDADAVLSETNAGITLATNRLILRNGLGTALITVNGSGDFDLTATVGPVQATRTLRDASNVSVTGIGGTLAGTATTWSGVVNVTNDVTVPAGHVLTIESNTIVLMNGVASGTTAPDLLIAGSIQCLGTESHPVTITCASAGLRWGQIRHNTAQPSLYRYTSITRAGRAPGEGHTGTGPAIRPNNSRVVFQNCTVSDTVGKIMQAAGSDLVMNETVLARAVMGPEIGSTGLLCTNTYIMEMRSNDDGDGIYLHGSGSRTLHMSRCVIAGLTGLTDDGIDTLDADVTIEDSIIRDWIHPSDDPKGISAFHGEVRVIRCVVDSCLIGISGKAGVGNSARIFIDSSTVIGLTNAVAAAYKDNAQGGNIAIHITNSIIRSVDALRSDFSAALTNFTIGYCNLSEPFEATGVNTNDPAFVDVANHDYRLRMGSPCIDAGDPAWPADPDGSRIDTGAFTFEVPQPLLSAPRPLPGGGFEFALSAYTNRIYRVEYSTNAQTWATLEAITHSNDPRTISDTAPDPSRIYRVRLGP